MDQRSIDKKTAVLVSVQLPDVTDLEHQSSLSELSHLAHTLGLKVIGTVSLKRKSITAASVYG
ncbi:MAG: hypothetical protein NTV34_00090 [Proteobacteria bacterium]|nr:hypothetical protein [Pseudomonadota bacterium]